MLISLTGKKRPGKIEQSFVFSFRQRPFANIRLMEHWDAFTKLNGEIASD